LCLNHALLGLGLFENHILQAPLHIVQPPERQRLRCRIDQGLRLAGQPSVVQAQRDHVLKHHVQQFKQQGANCGLVLRSKREPKAEIGEHELQRARRRRGRTQKLQQLRAEQMQAGIVGAQAGQCVFYQPRNLLGQLVG